MAMRGAIDETIDRIAVTMIIGRITKGGKDGDERGNRRDNRQNRGDNDNRQ